MEFCLGARCMISWRDSPFNVGGVAAPVVLVLIKNEKVFLVKCSFHLSMNNDDEENPDNAHTHYQNRGERRQRAPQGKGRDSANKAIKHGLCLKVQKVANNTSAINSVGLFLSTFHVFSTSSFSASITFPFPWLVSVELWWHWFFWCWWWRCCCTRNMPAMFALSCHTVNLIIKHFISIKTTWIKSICSLTRQLARSGNYPTALHGTAPRNIMKYMCVCVKCELQQPQKR